MATLHIGIGDDTYQRLAQQAAAQNTTVEELVGLLLAGVEHPSQGLAAWRKALAKVEQTSQGTASPGAVEREKAFREWMAMVQERADHLPPGFIVDDSRESIYEGRGE